MRFAHSLLTVSGLTILSRLTGFLRDTLMATFLGAGPLADAYVVAQRLPNVFRSLFAEGAFSAAFVPLYTAERHTSGPHEAQRFAGESLAALVAVLIPFSALVILGMPWVLCVLAPGFHDTPATYETAVFLCRITFIYLLLISVTVLQGSVLNAHGRFAPAAFSPVVFNLVLIAAFFVASPFAWPVATALAVAGVVAGVFQVALLAWSCHRAGVSVPLLRPHLSHATRRLLRQIVPGAFGAGASQINLLLSTILASTLAPGALAWLFYADRLNQLPLGVIGVAVATTLLPILAQHVQTNNTEGLRHATSRALEFCLALGLPAAVGLAVLSQPIVHVLFEHGAFSASDAAATATALAAYAPGIPAFFLVRVFSARFFARHDTKTPVKIALCAVGANLILALLFLGPLGHIGLALANSIASWVNALLLLRLLRTRKEGLTDQRLRQRQPRLVLCTAFMGLVAGTSSFLAQPWLVSPHVLVAGSALGAIIGLAGLVYILALHVTGAFRVSEALALFRRPKKAA